MRTSVVLLAVMVVVLGPGSAWSQRKARVTSKSRAGQSAPLVGQAPSPEPDPARDRERAIFREWAKAIRETVEASKRLSKKQAERDAWAVKSAKVKEDKLRTRYRLSSYALFLITKRGLAEKWPTEKPEDLEVVKPIVDRRQEYLDAVIFEEELNAWVAAHTPSNVGRTRDSLEAAQDLLGSAVRDSARDAELRKRAPIYPCMAKLLDDRLCRRRVVGPPGRMCYEHRDPEKDVTK
jgi:hypothetical protein